LREEDFESNQKGGESTLIDSLPFPLYEEYEECSTIRGVWTPPWTPE
jgi:hypothetical protein